MSYIYLVLFAYLSLTSAQEYVRVCYYTNWSQYRSTPMGYVPEDIDPSLCTHVIFAFAQIGNGNTLQTHERNDVAMYQKLAGIKQVKHFSNLLIRLTINYHIPVPPVLGPMLLTGP